MTEPTKLEAALYACAVNVAQREGLSIETIRVIGDTHCFDGWLWLARYDEQLAPLLKRLREKLSDRLPLAFVEFETEDDAASRTRAIVCVGAEGIRRRRQGSGFQKGGR